MMALELEHSSALDGRSSSPGDWQRAHVLSVEFPKTVKAMIRDTAEFLLRIFPCRWCAGR
jgi:hypothetical protein